jgi:hypothetical protein
MAFMLAHFEIDDFDTWKRERFDADPAGRKQSAKNHVISRGVDDPSQVFIRLEFGSADEAASFRERLMESGALEGLTIKIPPTVVEVADSAEYS